MNTDNLIFWRSKRFPVSFITYTSFKANDIIIPNITVTKRVFYI